MMLQRGAGFEGIPGRLGSVPTLNDTTQVSSGRNLLFVNTAVPAKEKSVAWQNTSRFVALAVTYALIAGHLIGNGYLMSTLSDDAAAAASPCIAAHSVVTGFFLGALQIAGNEISAALGSGKTKESDKDHPRAEAVMKTAWWLGLVSGLLGFAAMRVAPYALPAAPNTIAAAKGYLDTYAYAVWPDLLITTLTQFPFAVEGGALAPLISTIPTIIYRVMAVALAWYFKQNGAGMEGIGYAAAIAAASSAILTHLYFLLNPTYSHYNLTRITAIPGVTDNETWKAFFAKLWAFLKPLLNSAWKLALQRITEWGNLALIILIIGVWSNEMLKAVQPSLQSMMLFSLCSQGLAQAWMIMAAATGKDLKVHKENFLKTNSIESINSYEKLCKENRKNFYFRMVAGLVLNIGFGAIMYFAREQITALFVPSGSPEKTVADACQLLFINAFAVAVDSVRIISGGALRGWGDLLYPTLASLICMTFIGVPVGFGVGATNNNDTSMLFIIRNITIFMAAYFNCSRFFMHSKNDAKLYQNQKIYGQLHGFIGLNPIISSISLSPSAVPVSLEGSTAIAEPASALLLPPSFFSNLATKLNTLPSLKHFLKGTEEVWTSDLVKKIIIQHIYQHIDAYVQEAKEKYPTINHVDDFLNLLSSNREEQRAVFCRALARELDCDLAITAPKGRSFLMEFIVQRHASPQHVIALRMNGDEYIADNNPEVIDAVTNYEVLDKFGKNKSFKEAVKQSISEHAKATCSFFNCGKKAAVMPAGQSFAASVNV